MIITFAAHRFWIHIAISTCFTYVHADVLMYVCMYVRRPSNSSIPQDRKCEV